MGNPHPSGEGSVFAYTLVDNCGGGSACLTLPPTSTSIVTIAGQPYFSGTAPADATRVSRNGRYVLDAQYIWAVAAPYTQVVQLHDLQTGLIQQPSSMLADGRQAITSGARVLSLDPRTHALTI